MEKPFIFIFTIVLNNNKVNWIWMEKENLKIKEKYFYNTNIIITGLTNL